MIRYSRFRSYSGARRARGAPLVRNFGTMHQCQLFCTKTKGKFEESYQFMYLVNMSTNVERREREREGKREHRRCKRHLLMSANRETVMVHFFVFLFFSVLERAVSWKFYNLSGSGSGRISYLGNRNAREILK